jgi:hypothetical protein
MATTVARLEALLTADTSRFDNAMDRSGQKTEGFASKLGSIAKAGALAAGAAGVGALIYTLKTGIGEWAASQKVAAQTDAVIKSTGGSANVTAKEVDKLATSLMKKSGIDDEVIKSGENMLLTFTNIRNEVGKGNDIFSQSTSILTDMSVALGTDMSKQAIQLGKALNDPIKGVSALARVGVTFTQGQKDQIKAMVDSGHTMDAQKLILRELNKEFGGSAEAAGKTLPGQIKILKEEFDNFAGDLVGKLIPVLTDLSVWFRKHWPEIRDVVTKVWKEDLQPIFAAFIELAIALVGAVVDHWDTIGPIVKKVGQIITDVVGTMTSILKVFADLLRGDWSAAWNDLKAAIGHALDAIVGIVQLEATILKKEMFALGGLLKDAVVAGVKGLAGEVWDLINNIGSLITDRLDAIDAWGARVGNKLKNAAVGAVTGLASEVWDVINNIGAFIANKASAIVGWGERIGTGIVSGVISGISGIAHAVGGAAESVARTVANAVIRLLNHVIDTVNRSLEFTFDTHIPKVGKITIDPPDIGHIAELAAGGIVTKPTLALIGESGPEAVVPLGAGGAGGTIVVQLVADARVLAEVLIDPLRETAAIFKQQSGRSAFA